MADLYAPIQNGKVVDTTTSSQKEDKEKKASGGLDKDSFLQLLVAEMQYQDPLEPTTNTEYISQFATFSQLEATQNVELSNKVAMANDLVGKQVIMKTTTETGNTHYVDGPVDYAYLENGKVFLSIKGGLYNIDELDSVIQQDYLDAMNIAGIMTSTINRLPAEQHVTLDREDQIKQARELYDSLTDYQKQYVDADAVKKLVGAEAALARLKAANEANE